MQQGLHHIHVFSLASMHCHVHGCTCHAWRMNALSGRQPAATIKTAAAAAAAMNVGHFSKSKVSNNHDDFIQAFWEAVLQSCEQ